MLTWLLGILVAMPLARGLWLIAGYLSGNAFPQPLSPEEERAALDALRRGDAGAEQLLVEHNLRLVAHLVKKFENTGEDPEDLIDIGAIGLIKAVKTFDPDKGVRLATYAARCIENEILMHLRAMRKSRSDISLYEPVGTDREGNEIALIEVLGTEPDTVSQQVETDVESLRLGPRLAHLDPKERQVVEMRYGLGGQRERTQREIAKMLGISRSYVSRIEKCACQSRRNRLALSDGLTLNMAGCPSRAVVILTPWPGSAWFPRAAPPSRCFGARAWPDLAGAAG